MSTQASTLPYKAYCAPTMYSVSSRTGFPSFFCVHTTVPAGAFGCKPCVLMVLTDALDPQPCTTNPVALHGQPNFLASLFDLPESKNYSFEAKSHT